MSFIYSNPQEELDNPDANSNQQASDALQKSRNGKEKTVVFENTGFESEKNGKGKTSQSIALNKQGRPRKSLVIPEGLLEVNVILCLFFFKSQHIGGRLHRDLYSGLKF